MAPHTRDGIISHLAHLPSGHIISGQHNREPNATYPAGSWNWNNSPDPRHYRPWTDKVNAITGIYPGSWGGDFLYGSPYTQDQWRQALVQQAIDQWNAGSLVHLSWHITPPNAGVSTSSDGVSTSWSGSDTSVNIGNGGYWRQDSTWQELLDYQANNGEGSGLYRQFLGRLNEVVPYFQALKDAGVVVLFRPYHEINTGWSWWGAGSDAQNYQRNYRQQLYQYTHNFFVHTHGFDNIVWVWNVQNDGPAEQGILDALYPGDEVVDVISHDVWNSNQPQSNWYSLLDNYAANHGKIIGLSEVGRLPDPHGALASQPNWKFFVGWAEFINDNIAEASQIFGQDITQYGGDQSNSNDYTKSVYYHDNVVHQGHINS